MAVLFALGGLDDLTAMSFHNMWQLALAGFLATGSTQTLTAAAIALLGLARPFGIITGLSVLLTFIFAAILLGEAVTWQAGLGAALVLLGVYLVALYGRPRAGAAAAAPKPRSARPPGGGSADSRNSRRPLRPMTRGRRGTCSRPSSSAPRAR